MKRLKIIFFFLTLMTAGLLWSSCGNNAGNNADKSEKQGREYTSAYVCPMHCEGSGSDQPGKCPVCGMEYEKNEDHKTDGHNH